VPKPLPATGPAIQIGRTPARGDHDGARPVEVGARGEGGDAGEGDQALAGAGGERRRAARGGHGGQRDEQHLPLVPREAVGEQPGEQGHSGHREGGDLHGTLRIRVRRGDQRQDPQYREPRGADQPPVPVPEPLAPTAARPGGWQGLRARQLPSTV
jgi:hypothetical protein